MLVEASTGRYPYDANVGPVELMIQVRGGFLGEGPRGPQYMCTGYETRLV